MRFGLVPTCRLPHCVFTINTNINSEVPENAVLFQYFLCWAGILCAIHVHSSRLVFARCCNVCPWAEGRLTVCFLFPADPKETTTTTTSNRSHSDVKQQHFSSAGVKFIKQCFKWRKQAERATHQVTVLFPAEYHRTNSAVPFEFVLMLFVTANEPQICLFFSSLS